MLHYLFVRPHLVYWAAYCLFPCSHLTQTISSNFKGLMDDALSLMLPSPVRLP